MDEKACDEWLVKNGFPKAGKTGKQLLDDANSAPRSLFYHKNLPFGKLLNTIQVEIIAGVRKGLAWTTMIPQKIS